MSGFIDQHKKSLRNTSIFSTVGAAGLIALLIIGIIPISVIAIVVTAVLVTMCTGSIGSLLFSWFKNRIKSGHATADQTPQRKIPRSARNDGEKADQTAEQQPTYNHDTTSPTAKAQGDGEAMSPKQKADKQRERESQQLQQQLKDEQHNIRLDNAEKTRQLSTTTTDQNRISTEAQQLQQQLKDEQHNIRLDNAAIKIQKAYKRHQQKVQSYRSIMLGEAQAQEKLYDLNFKTFSENKTSLNCNKLVSSLEHLLSNFSHLLPKDELKNKQELLSFFKNVANNLLEEEKNKSHLALSNELENEYAVMQYANQAQAALEQQHMQPSITESTANARSIKQASSEQKTSLNTQSNSIKTCLPSKEAQSYNNMLEDELTILQYTQQAQEALEQQHMQPSVTESTANARSNVAFWQNLQDWKNNHFKIQSQANALKKQIDALEKRREKPPEQLPSAPQSSEQSLVLFDPRTVAEQLAAAHRKSVEQQALHTIKWNILHGRPKPIINVSSFNFFTPFLKFPLTNPATRTLSFLFQAQNKTTNAEKTNSEKRTLTL